MIRTSRDKFLPLEVPSGISRIWVCRMSREEEVERAGCGCCWVFPKRSPDPAVPCLWCPEDKTPCWGRSFAPTSPLLILNLTRPGRIPRIGITLPCKIHSEKVTGFRWILQFGNIGIQASVGLCMGQRAMSKSESRGLVPLTLQFMLQASLLTNY